MGPYLGKDDFHRITKKAKGMVSAHNFCVIPKRIGIHYFHPAEAAFLQFPHNLAIGIMHRIPDIAYILHFHHHIGLHSIWRLLLSVV